jgi:hypothetical protein
LDPVFHLTAVAEVLSSFQADGASAAEVNSIASCVGTTLGIVFPLRPKLATTSWIQNIRGSARKMELVSDVRQKFRDLNAWWNHWIQAGANRLLSNELLRIKVICFLTLDVFGRPKDMTKIPLGAPGFFYFRPQAGCHRLYAGFLAPKGSTAFVWFEVEPYHMEPHLCTVCAVREWLIRRGKFFSPALKTLSLPLEKKDGSIELWSGASLFCSSVINKSVGKFPPLGKERISKILKESFIKFGGFPADFKGKDVRAVAASLAFNLGVSEERILAGGRWARWSTVNRHYVRRALLRQFDVKSMAGLSMAAVLRTRTQPG